MLKFLSECLLNLKPAAGLCVRPAAGLCVRPVVEGGYCPRLKVGIAAGGRGDGLSRLSALTRRCHPAVKLYINLKTRKISGFNFQIFNLKIPDWAPYGSPDCLPDGAAVPRL